VPAPASGTDWTAIDGIVVAGVVGPAVGYFVAWRADQRRFRHERELKASDDLRMLLDDVEVALDRLAAACAEMRSQVLQHLGDDRVIPSWRAADDAYQHARAVIARLGMRPHADAQLVKRARDAARGMFEAIRLVDVAILNHRANLPDLESDAAMAVPAAINRGYEGRNTYEALAREALARLLGTAEPENRPARAKE
jgi:hypothetical protein